MPPFDSAPAAKIVTDKATDEALSYGAQNVLDHHRIFRAGITDAQRLWGMLQTAATKELALGHTERFKLFRSNTRDGQAVRDAAGLALGEELLHISAEQVRFIEQLLKSTDQIPPVDDPPALGAASYAWAFLSAAGTARWSDELDGDYPEALLLREGRNSTDMRNALAGYSYSDLDLARAALIPGMALPREKAQRAARMIAVAVDTAMYTGAAGGVTLPGLLTQTAGVVNSQNTSGALSGKTSAQLYDFFAGEFDAYLATFGDAPKPMGWHCLVPLAVHLQLSSSNVGDHLVPVEQLLMRAYGSKGFQGFDFVRFCDDQGTGGSAMACIYPRDPMVAGRVVAASYLESEPHREAFRVSVAAYARVGGVAIKQPALIRYVYDL